MRRFFSQEVLLIVLFDQRGAGQPIYYAETRENGTRHLIGDIQQLCLKLGIEKMILFDGSWGSTLALVYSEVYPKRVSGMVLRGLFTATQREIDDC